MKGQAMTASIVPIEGPKLVKAKVMAEVLGICLPTFYRLVQNGRVPYYTAKAGVRELYRFNVEEVLASMRVSTSTGDKHA